MIPGIPVGSYPAGPRPLRLLTGGLLLRSGTADLAGHRRHWGAQPALHLHQLIAAAAPVIGAGGAEFPSARKIKLLAQQRVAAVVVNAMEGEPASAKDAMLLIRAPHLVLDGAAVTARALGTRRVVIRMADGPAVDALRRAIAERRDAKFEISRGPERFVAGEASAIARALRGGPALPDGRGRPPTIGKWRPAPVLLSNVETFARLAVATRGHLESSALLTVSGAVGRSGVVELPATATLGDLMSLAQARDPRILVSGGWHGAWLPWHPDLAATRLTRDAIRAVGGRWGAGVMVVLGADPDPQDVLDAVADYLAEATAGQCGPCVHGLPALAQAIQTRTDPEPLISQVSGRGLCAHPAAATAALMSGVATVAAVAAQRQVASVR